MNQIQFQFLCPGSWGQFMMTAVFEDAAGFTVSKSYQPGEIPEEQAPAMQAVVAALVGLGEDWQAVQVWARLAEVYAPEADVAMMVEEAVELTVEAVNPQGGRRVFTVDDYHEFTVTDAAAVAFFKFFTTK